MFERSVFPRKPSFCKKNILFLIKVVKLYAWEKIFAEKASAVRKEELKAVKKQSFIRVSSDILGKTSYYVVSFNKIFLE